MWPRGTQHEHEARVFHEVLLYSAALRTSPHAAPAPSLSLGRSTSVSSGQACRILQYRRSATLPKLVRGAPEQDPTVPCHCSRKMLLLMLRTLGILSLAYSRWPFVSVPGLPLNSGGTLSALSSTRQVHLRITKAQVTIPCFDSGLSIWVDEPTHRVGQGELPCGADMQDSLLPGAGSDLGT